MTGKIIRDLPPTAANNRNSESAFIDILPSMRLQMAVSYWHIVPEVPLTAAH